MHSAFYTGSGPALVAHYTLYIQELILTRSNLQAIVFASRFRLSGVLVKTVPRGSRML